MLFRSAVGAVVNPDEYGDPDGVGAENMSLFHGNPPVLTGFLRKFQMPRKRTVPIFFNPATCGSVQYVTVFGN